MPECSVKIAQMFWERWLCQGVFYLEEYNYWINFVKLLFPGMIN